MNKIQSLLEKTNTIVSRYNQLLDNTGGRFNIFKVIGLSTEETRLHSAFLTELINPHGTHGLKDQFLAAFIKHCIEDYIDFYTEDSKCEAEYYIGPKTETTGGKIDILIRDKINQAIIIENKINAPDQERQMLRYYNHSKSYNNARLIYLSLDGKDPSEYSTGKEHFEFKTISYQYEIINWLTECKKIAVDFPLVREGITHYMNLIKQLTNTSSMDEMKNEIISLIMQSSDNMQNAFELAKVLTDVRIKLQWEFWKQLERDLFQVGIKIEEEDSKRVKHWKIKSYYTKQRNRDIHYGLWTEIHNKEGITIHWGCEIEDNIYTGFTIEKNGVGGIANTKEFEQYRTIILECNNAYQSNSNWLGWKHTSPILNFREINTDQLYAIVEKKNLEEVTKSIAIAAIRDINFVVSKLAAMHKEQP